MLKLCLVFILLICSVYASTASWHSVLEVKGTASKQTDLFETTGSKWRIRWEKPSADSLNIYVYDQKGNPVDVISAKKTTSDESYIHKAGKFYLSISASREYVVTVEDWR